MKNRSIMIRLGALLLAALFALSACGAAGGGKESVSGEKESVSLTDVRYAARAQSVKKSETVYVNMLGDGSVDQITVSDWLHADRAEVQVSDRTTLKDFSVVKGQASVIGETGDIVWQMADSDVYYQGASDAQLPVDFRITYTLDGVRVPVDDLAGRSGHLLMEIHAQNNVKKDVQIDGKTVTIHTPLVVVGGMMLPYEHFDAIQVHNGLSVGGGTNEIVVLEGTPGLEESLQLSSIGMQELQDLTFSDTFRIEADVTDFTLGDMYFAVMPLSSLNLDVKLPETLEEARNVLEKLKDVESLINRIDPEGSLSSFVSDPDAFRELIDTMKTAVDTYSANQKLVSTLLKTMTPENIEKLSKLADTLSNEDVQRLLNLLSNVPNLQSVINALSLVSADLAEVQPILEEFGAALEDPEVKKELENLPETLKQLKTLTDYMKAHEDALDVVAGVAQSGDLTQLLDALSALSDKANAPDAGAAVSDTAQDVVARFRAWIQYDYGVYTDAEASMQTSCMFIYKTAPLS